MLLGMMRCHLTVTNVMQYVSDSVQMLARAIAQATAPLKIRLCPQRVALLVCGANTYPIAAQLAYMLRDTRRGGKRQR